MDEFEQRPSAAAQKHQAERACAQLVGLVSGITADGYLHELEIQFLRTWLSANRQAAEHWIGHSLADQIDAILADGIVTDDELAALMTTLQGVAGVQFAETGCVTPDTISFPADDCAVQLSGATVCLTGKFHYGSRAECEQATTAAGAICHDAVTKKITYLVIGSAGATTSWKQATYGNKIDGAMKLKEKGHRLYIVPEEAWRLALSV